MTQPDLPPDLDRLRVLETWLQLQLDAVRAAITAAEQAQPTAWPEFKRGWRDPDATWRGRQQ